MTKSGKTEGFARAGARKASDVGAHAAAVGMSGDTDASTFFGGLVGECDEDFGLAAAAER